MKSLLDSLREATRESHRQLEDALQIESCLDDGVAYRRLLEGFLGLHEPLERRLAECAGLEDTGYRMAERTKISALREDLRALGAAESDLAKVPRFAAPAFPNVAAALGTAYVLEGSTLGGQSITRLLAAKSSDLPAEFFNVYGAQTRDRWMSFLDCLAALPLTEAHVFSATSAARATFDDFAQWLK